MIDADRMASSADVAARPGLFPVGPTPESGDWVGQLPFPGWHPLCSHQLSQKLIGLPTGESARRNANSRRKPPCVLVKEVVNQRSGPVTPNSKALKELLNGQGTEARSVFQPSGIVSLHCWVR